MLEDIREGLRPIWSVYVLINKTKKEIYFGVSKRPCERISEEHARGETEAIAEWNWITDEIVEDILYSELDRYSASRKAHHLETCVFKGYKVHQTAGI